MKSFLKTLLAAFIGSLVAILITTWLLFCLIGAMVAFSEETTPVVPSKAILKIDLNNPITENGQTDLSDIYSLDFSQQKSLSLLKAIRAIDNAATDPSIKFIYINSKDLNISISNLEELRAALSRFRNSGKAIIAYGDNYSQGSYYLASVADKVYINNEGTSAMIGIGSNMLFFKDLLDKLGIQVQLIRHGKFKAAAEQFIAPNISKENYEQNKRMVSSIWNTWISQISESRDISVDRINELVDNLDLFTAKSLLEHNLVDSTVTREQMTNILCTLFDVKKAKDIKAISLYDYAQASLKNNLKAKDKVAVVYAEGEITMYENEGLSAQKFMPILNNLRNDSTVKAVVLRVNSPGGDSQAADIINDEIQLIRKNKPVVVSMGEYAASGGYWISAHSDKIYSDNTTITGSIGVFSMATNVGKGLKEHLHINSVGISSNEHTNMLNGIDPLTPKEIDFMQDMVEDVYTQFIDLVATGRNLQPNYVDSIAQGRIWTGADAIKLKLVDEIGGLQQAIEYAAMLANVQNYRISEFPKPKSQMDQLLELFSGTSASAKVLADPQSLIKSAYQAINKENNLRTYARIPYYYEFKY